MFSLRVAFGVSLALFGIAHYLDVQGFAGMTAGGFTGVLASLATLWAYVLPLLMIVGGALVVVGYRPDIAAWCAGVALASIAIGMSLKMTLGAADAATAGGAIQSVMLWLLVYLFAIKGLACGCGAKGGRPGGTCAPGGSCH